MMITSGQKPAYPTNEEALQGTSADQQQQKPPENAGNPFVDALRTVAMFCVAQKEKGNEAPVQAFQAFLQSLQGGVGGTGTQAGSESLGEISQAPEAPMPGKRMLGTGMSPKGNMQENRKAKILTM